MRNEEPKYITILKGLRKPTKYFYNELLETINQVQSKYKQDWENSLENDLDWVYHHQLPFKATIETKLQSFQFNIIHRCLVTNSKLWYFKLRDNNRCSFCNLCKETIEHLFWECPISKTVWLQLKDWFTNVIGVTVILSATNILLGMADPTNRIPINHILMIVKYYIYTCRCKNDQPSIEGSIAKIKHCIKVEKSANLVGHDQKWRQFIGKI